MISKDEFNKYLDELLENENDIKKLKYLTGFQNKLGYVYFTLAIVFAFFSLFSIAIKFWIGIGLFLVLSVCSAIIAHKKWTKVDDALKYFDDNYINLIISYLLDGYEHTLNRRYEIEEEIFRQSQFVRSYDEYRGEDLLDINVTGDNKLSKLNLKLCDVETRKIIKTKSGNNGTRVNFNGIFGYIEFPSEFKCVLSLNDKFQNDNCVMEKVELEDIDFNESFDVYSNDQVEARYVLTPDVMSILLSLKRMSKKMSLNLVGNRLYVSFKDMRLFEMKDARRNSAVSMFKNFYDPICVVLSLVNEIKKNNKLFKI